MSHADLPVVFLVHVMGSGLEFHSPAQVDPLRDGLSFVDDAVNRGFGTFDLVRIGRHDVMNGLAFFHSVFYGLVKPVFVFWRKIQSYSRINQENFIVFLRVFCFVQVFVLLTTAGPLISSVANERKSCQSPARCGVALVVEPVSSVGFPVAPLVYFL